MHCVYHYLFLLLLYTYIYLDRAWYVFTSAFVFDFSIVFVFVKAIAPPNRLATQPPSRSLSTPSGYLLPTHITHHITQKCFCICSISKLPLDILYMVHPPLHPPKCICKVSIKFSCWLWWVNSLSVNPALGQQYLYWCSCLSSTSG